MADGRRYWFPAKRYGWGWGPPVTWQGWLVLALYILAILALGLAFLPSGRPIAFTAGVAVATGVMLLIAWRTGEPPRWRWGGD